MSPTAPGRFAESLLIRHTRLVPIGGAAAPAGPIDVRVTAGVVTEIGERLTDHGEPVLDGSGRWAIPGLWDQHVHMSTWAQTRLRLDLADTASPEDVTARIANHIAGLPSSRDGSLVQACGYRSATWHRPPTVRELDAVSGDHPVVMISGDAHNGWLNSRALRMLGLQPRDTVLEENEWFLLMGRLDELPGASEGVDRAYRQSVRDAAAKGVVGVADMEWGPGYLAWPERFANGIDQLRVRPATYSDGLEDVVAAGLRTGDPLPEGGGLLTMGPLKIISDGSLNSRTAYCCDPYADAADLPQPHGKQNLSPGELVRLMRRGTRCGLQVALHTIGDAAGAVGLDAYEHSGARGTIEHAQLMRREDITRMARHGIRASVQPAHVWDDRDPSDKCWPDRTDRCFMIGTMLRSGVTLALGSDAPVAALDPWLAMAAAVWRSGDDRPAWHQDEAISPADALAASTDGQRTIVPGSRGDIALLDDDPLAAVGDARAVAVHLRQVTVGATILAGRITHDETG
ncbi:amidohydrolase [Leekyejoonella antrihumi]|uniref:Amidohydrolase family protein n=1 Tax=Leekyejoonella antrihumi TaxID=1660198 RepID=A0A563E6X6_9MICO|nr:amidohydrolase family protein [Leekyejoonella antrihumi]TWP38013.1 amidohydrolase family protein [Leekyejoonella antrihumi]